MRDHQKGTCSVCGGTITYYARKNADPAPRTSSIDDTNRWAHDNTSDWLTSPHRATPTMQAVA